MLTFPGHIWHFRSGVDQSSALLYVQAPSHPEQHCESLQFDLKSRGFWPSTEPNARETREIRGMSEVA